ncbi:hypothetical protein BDL97_12G054400 [Sphagnum fallax]|nr:hypothetical protein BDL97_12G054400 [Sphagnum fallax]
MGRTCIARSPVPRLIASGLACMRNEQVIIRDVNMTPHEGSGLIITGPNASGKSTFLRVLCGFIKPSAGRLLWDGVDLSQPGLYDLYRPNVHLVAAKDAIKKPLTVYENVRKRLQLARMLAVPRPLWLLDEPSVGLDAEGVEILEELIGQHWHQGGIVLVATHVPINLPDALALRLPPRVPQFRQYTAADYA